MDDEQFETFFIIKYVTMDAAMLNWLTNPIEFTAEESEFFDRYTKRRFPNLNLISSTDPFDKPE